MAWCRVREAISWKICQKSVACILISMLLTGCTQLQQPINKAAPTPDSSTPLPSAVLKDIQQQSPFAKAPTTPRPYLQLQSAKTSDALPKSRIATVNIPKGRLSDAIIRLLQNVNLRLRIKGDLPDPTITDLVLKGTFPEGLATLARAGNFFYSLHGDILTISAKQQYSILLPPSGYISDGTAGIEPVTYWLKKELRKRFNLKSVQQSTTDHATRLTLSLHKNAAVQLGDWLISMREEKLIVATNLTHFQLNSPFSLPASAFTADDAHFSLLKGAFSVKQLRTVLAGNITSMETGLLSSLSGVSASKTKDCAHNNRHQERVTVHAAPQAKTLLLNIFVDWCGTVDSARVAVNALQGESVVLLLPGNNVVLLSPTIIKLQP